MMATKGCAYGMVNREMINNVKKDIGDIKLGIDKIDGRTTQMFNHMTERLDVAEKRWPKGAVIALQLITAVATAVLTFGAVRLFWGA